MTKLCSTTSWAGACFVTCYCTPLTSAIFLLQLGGEGCRRSRTPWSQCGRHGSSSYSCAGPLNLSLRSGCCVGGPFVWERKLTWVEGISPPPAIQINDMQPAVHAARAVRCMCSAPHNAHAAHHTRSAQYLVMCRAAHIAPTTKHHACWHRMCQRRKCRCRKC